MSLDDICYISIGSECSSAAALRNLQLRNFALPFDWVVTSPIAFTKCIMDDFHLFHKQLQKYNQSRIIDAYGILYPHDYPTVEARVPNPDGTYTEKPLAADWANYSGPVVEKYERRITRFLNLMNGPQPLVILYRGSVSNVCLFKSVFTKKYNKTNIVFVVATNEQTDESNIFTCQPEKNGKWNDELIWKETIDRAVRYLV
jgi:hypothetical protein